MLDKHLIAKTRAKARKENIVLWGEYRITVLQDRLFRIEKNAQGKYRDEATQAVWFRDVGVQEFTVSKSEEKCVIETKACKVYICAKRENCRIELNGKLYPIDNTENLKGTYRTLDCCNGRNFVPTAWNQSLPAGPIPLCDGVCSLNGIAVLNDVDSLTLGEDGEVKPERGLGSDEYVFVYGNDYRAAVNALYKICGSVPMIPRYALGNWWSRYYVYTDKEYLRLLNAFEEKEVPLDRKSVV